MNWFVEHPEVMRYILEHEQSNKTNDWVTEAARNFAARHVFECELQEEGLPIPVVWMEDALVHTDERPYCGDPECPCHYDQRQYGTTIDRPFENGLITYEEGNALYRGRNI